VGVFINNPYSQTNTLDLSVFGSISYHIINALGIDLRYVQGYSDNAAQFIYSDFDGDEWGRGGLRTRVIQIVLSYKLFDQMNKDYLR